MTEDGAVPRRRNAAATRTAILNSAIAAFTEHGYDAVGVREIAASAGVTAMLVNRYFGSKEQLFAEAVDVSFAPRTVVTGDTSTLTRDAVARLVKRTAPEADDLDPFLLTLRSAGNARATEIVREGIARHVAADVLKRLAGAAAPERSELLLSLIAGIWLMRRVIGTPALTGADPETLVPLVERLFTCLTDPEQGSNTANGAAVDT
jgi:AcrR family transcriptional regulator